MPVVPPAVSEYAQRVVAAGLLFAGLCVGGCKTADRPTPDAGALAGQGSGGGAPNAMPNQMLHPDAGTKLDAGAGGWRTTGGRKSMGKTQLPCAVDKVVDTSCRSCHSANPGLLAPMALVSYEDLLAPAVSNPSRKVYEVAKQRVHAVDAPMPPLSSRRLTADELAALDAFFDDAPQQKANSCGGELPDPSDAGTDAAVQEPDDIGECYRVQAHDVAEPGDTTPFQLPNGERYACFYFAVPWPANSQAVSVRSLDTPHTHHWQLYHIIESYIDGAITRQAANCGFNLRDVLGVYSHSDDHEQRMPDGVGLELPPPSPEHGLLLEIHYYNPNDTVGDTTGAEICTAKAPREHSATIAVLGSNDFTIPPGQSLETTGACTPLTQDVISIFRIYPHMHARGVRMDSWIERKGGTKDLLLDEPFDFNNQKMYDVAAQVQPGDSVRTNCHFVNNTDQPISTGFNADEEMCNQFVYYWPAGAISSGMVDGVPVPCLVL